MANSLVEAVMLTVPEPPSRKKTCKDQATKTDDPENSVTFVYQTKVAESLRCVTVSWCKNPTDHFLSMSVENTLEENKYTCKIDLESGQSWGKKGLRSFEIQGARVDIFWDLRKAKFNTSPQPCSGYYVALVYKKEVLLLLGDLENDAYDRTKSKPSPEEATLLCKRDNVYGKKLFCTRAILEDGNSKTEHDVVIETSLCGPDDPEMWISIDGMLASRIMNLHWRFRGNEIVMVNNLPVQIFWDVHDWLFNDLGSGPAFFVFKPGFVETTSDSNGRECSGRSGGSSMCELLEENPSSKGYCHFLYAWRMD
ncbi:uncharacterized protein LOC114915023 [Cajanus cajan]|nr:uncharacterized protein LOC114915023 [Cajanus cajan]